MGPAFGRGSDSVHPSERPQLRFRPQYHLRSLRQYLRSLRDFDDTRLGWDPGPRHQCHRVDLGGPGPPSGPAHRTQASHPPPGPSHLKLLQLQRRHLRLSCHLLPGSGGRCSSGTPFRGTYGSTAESSIRSRTTMSRYSRLFRDSMRLIEDYSLLPFMTPRQYYYPRVVLQFYHSMTSQGAAGPLELQFSIDDRPGVLRAADISAALGLRIPPANSEGYRAWAHPPHREMVRILARDTTAGPVLFRRQLPPQMLLVDHLFRTSLFPLQHYVQRRGAILEALYRVSEGYWFSPSELVMTSLMHFEEKVHRKGLVRADSLPLLMPRLLCQVLEHLGFPEELRIEMRVRCPLVLSMERVMAMPVSFILQQQDQEEVPAPEPEVQRSPAPQVSPPSPPLHTTSAAAADTPGPSYSAHHSPEYVHASSREIAGVMDAICSLTATQAAQDQRLAQCHSMLQQIMTHLGLPRVPDQRYEPVVAASLDVLAAAAAATDPPPPQQ